MSPSAELVPAGANDAKETARDDGYADGSTLDRLFLPCFRRRRSEISTNVVYTENFIGPAICLLFDRKKCLLFDRETGGRRSMA
jgi:hypothetical protein